MILQICTVHDVKARAFLPPFYCSTLEVASRTFADCANNLEHAFGKNPEDYSLYHLGSFNDDTAVFITLPQPVNLGMALLYTKGVPNVQ